MKILGIDRIGNLEQVLAQVRLPGRPHQLEEVRTGPGVVEDFEGFAGELCEHGGDGAVFNADESSVEVHTDVRSIDGAARGVAGEDGLVGLRGLVRKPTEVPVRRELCAQCSAEWQRISLLGAQKDFRGTQNTTRQKNFWRRSGGLSVAGKFVVEDDVIAARLLFDLQHLAFRHQGDSRFLQDFLEERFVQSMAGLGQTTQNAASLTFAMGVRGNGIAVLDRGRVLVAVVFKQ